MTLMFEANCNGEMKVSVSAVTPCSLVEPYQRCVP
jgi:hypothetical protein